MAKELADFVSFDLGLESQELDNLSMWVRANPVAHSVLCLKYIPSSRKLKIELPRHLLARGREREAPADPRNHVAKVQQAARDARSRGTHQGMERVGEAIAAVDAQVQQVRLEQPPPPSKGLVGWSTALRPECIGPFIGKNGHNIQRLQRALGATKLIVEPKNGSECVRIEAPTEAILNSALRAVIDEEQFISTWAGRKRKRPRSFGAEEVSKAKKLPPSRPVWLAGRGRFC